MAGSYSHITGKNNVFIGVDLIDNLGDAHEALEECYEIIQILSGGSKEKILKAIKKIYLSRNPDKKTRQRIKSLSARTYWDK